MDLDSGLDELRTDAAVAARRAERAAAERLRAGTDLHALLRAVAESGEPVAVGLRLPPGSPLVEVEGTVVGLGADLVSLLRVDGSMLHVRLGAVTRVETQRPVRPGAGFGGHGHGFGSDDPGTTPLETGDDGVTAVLTGLVAHRAEVVVTTTCGSTISGEPAELLAGLVRMDTGGGHRRCVYVDRQSIVALAVRW